jgi:predicted peptidase
MDTKVITVAGLDCIIKYPQGFKAEGSYPVILLLHGAGSRGKDIDILLNNAFFKDTKVHSEFPFVTFAPQCPENRTWFDFMPQLETLVNTIQSFDFTDNARLYLMGPSMGGYGTWQLAMRLPECFAAAVAICGGGMYWNAGRLVNVPILAFHGALDQTVLPEESEKMVNAVNKKGGNAKLTIYPENAHNAWTDTYKNPEVFKWLLSHKNTNAKILSDEYTDGKIYG